MLIELRGVEFVNKGAELMLHAIIQEVKKEIPSARFVMEINPRVPFAKVKKLNILAKSNLMVRGRNIGPLLDFLPNRLKAVVGIACEKEINVILDGSGFAYGDKWGAEKAGARTANHIRRWKEKGIKVILLPQAFGPFSGEPIRANMRLILENADLIIARDSVSYKYLTDLSPDNPRVLQFPDFTNLIEGSVPTTFDSAQHQIAIIPNQKMMETDNLQENEAYPHFLMNIISRFLNKGEKPFFLIHESDEDFKLANKINHLLPQPIDIIKIENPLAVKGIIGKSKVVITSRFHGLVSALSQSIPCLATGWSHKYEMLLEDYNYAQGLCTVNDPLEYLEEKINMLLDRDSRSEIINNLKTNSVKQKELSQKMWKKVKENILEMDKK